MKRLLFIAFLLIAISAGAQDRWVSRDFDFVEYLIDNDLRKDASVLLDREHYFSSDTLTFLKGWTCYQLKELEPALEQFRLVPADSPFAQKAFFYGNAVAAHLGDYDPSLLNGYDGPYKELQGVQLACLALLRDDPAAYREASKSFGYTSFALTEAENQLSDIYAYRYEKPRKSPWLAAAASAVVPGLGKIYAGRVGEGVEAFLLTGISGAITAGYWVKDGPTDWKTIAAGLVSAVLYIGNIYGSYVSVSIVNNDIKNVQDTAILYNIHIPLRSVFK